jgi:hypothetical protein
LKQKRYKNDVIQEPEIVFKWNAEALQDKTKEVFQLARREGGKDM